MPSVARLAWLEFHQTILVAVSLEILQREVGLLVGSERLLVGGSVRILCPHPILDLVPELRRLGAE
jgi:hypothetical protein